MKRIGIIAGGLVMLGVVAVSGLLLHGGTRAAHADGVGGTLSVGTPSFAAGPPATVAVPVNLTNPTDAYYAWNVHLRWDPTLLKPAAPAFTLGTALAGCSSASTTDVDGGGIVIGCSLTGSGSSTAAGLVVTLNLQVLAAGCSNLHLFTYGSPDGGDSLTGTYTLDNNLLTPQANTYGEDAGVNTATGATCQPAPVGTPTDTATSTATGTATATATITQTPTQTGTPTQTATATATGTPTQTATVTNTPTITATPTQTGTPTNTNTPGAGAASSATPTVTSPAATSTAAPQATPTRTSAVAPVVKSPAAAGAPKAGAGAGVNVPKAGAGTVGRGGGAWALVLLLGTAGATMAIWATMRRRTR